MTEIVRKFEIITKMIWVVEIQLLQEYECMKKCLITNLRNKFWRLPHGFIRVFNEQEEEFNYKKYEEIDGYKATYDEEGELHSYDDDPALISPHEDKYWMKNGLFHRLARPSVKYKNGEIEYWVEGNQYSFKDFNREGFNLKSHIKTEDLYKKD